MPSHLKTRSTFFEGRMNSSSGPTTVGPETTSTAPSTSATSQERSKNSWAATVRPPRREDPDAHQPAINPCDVTRELAELQVKPGLEEDDADRDRHHGGDQLRAQQRVGIERAGGAGAEAQREQQQDRREPQQPGDQRRRSRQDRHKPELEQGSRVGERRQWE
ncbi:MAG: hypothetical protein ACXVVQ_13255 [Solirubrobacteraceae bacterium]